MIDSSKIKKGDVFSEESHYVAENSFGNSIIFKHLQSGEEVRIAASYAEKYFKSAEQFNEVIEVSKEDSKDGTKLGIRSIFENIETSKVFTVVFTKQGKTKSAAAVKAELAKQRTDAIELIEKAKASKKSMAKAYEEALSFIQDNPITNIIEGEDRTLVGYKVQFKSRDGKYDCVDVNLKSSGESNYIRPVNINTIKELIVDGIKYIVK